MPADELRRQLSGLNFPLDDATRAEVQRCVCEYVDSAKAESWPTERMLLGLKRIAEEAGITSNVLLLQKTQGARANLLIDIVGWGIGRYFASHLL